MKNTKKKLFNQSKVVKAFFTGSNITKYSGLNTVAKCMNRQNIVKSISACFPTQRHNATKFGVNQILMSITLASISGINRICRIAAFSGDGLIKALLKLDKAINEDAISATLKGLGQKGARKLQDFLVTIERDLILALHGNVIIQVLRKMLSTLLRFPAPTVCLSITNS
jgi:hypothetical protein